MSTEKAKFQLFAKLAELGFTYDESDALRRIEMTLHRWAERECGDGSDWAIERDDDTGKPFNAYHGPGSRTRYAIADREAGALLRLATILSVRNMREEGSKEPGEQNPVSYYHEGDPRGCALYLLRAADIPAGCSVESCYNRGLAVCA